MYIEAEARNNNYERKIGTETVKFYGTEFLAAAMERVRLRERRKPTSSGS